MKCFSAVGILVMLILTSVPAYTAQTCRSLTLNAQSSPPKLIPVSCNDPQYSVLAKLQATSQFPDITFLGDKNNIPGCYVSESSIPALLGPSPGTPVNITTRSAIISPDNIFELPFLFGGSGTFLTIGTQWTLSDESGNMRLGLFTFDAINLSTSWELDKIFSSTKAGVIGSLRVHSVLQSDGSILLDAADGLICGNNGN